MMPCLPLLLAALSPAPQDLALTHVDVVDVVAGERLADRTVIVAGGRIAWVGPASEARIPGGTPVREAKGRFLIPGLWDMHVHVNRNVDETLSLPLFLANGVTGVREMGSGCLGDEPGRPCLDGLRAWARRVDAGELAGPRLVALSSPLLRSDRDLGGDVEGSVKRFAEEGADFVKVLQGLSTGTYFELMDAASEVGLPVAGHVPLGVGMLEAARAGQRSIEHARDVLFDGFPGSADWRAVTDTQAPPVAVLRRMVDEHDPALLDEIAAAMVEHDTWYCPTHLTRRFDAHVGDEAFRHDPREAYVHPGRWDSWNHDADSTLAQDDSPGAQATYEAVFELGLEATRRLADAGVGILAGTDANDSYVFPGWSLHDELELLQEAGLSPAAVLRSATSDAARFLGRETDFGTIEPGRMADLVLLRADPLADVANARATEAVVLGGRLRERKALDELLAGVRTAVDALTPKVVLDEDTRARYAGTYDAPPGRIVIWFEGDEFWFTVGDDARRRMRPESETRFTYQAEDVAFRFEPLGADGVQRITITRGGSTMEAVKVD